MDAASVQSKKPLKCPGRSMTGRHRGRMRRKHMFEIREDDLSGEPTCELLRLHLAGMRADSPPGEVFALDLSGLQTPDITVWTA